MPYSFCAGDAMNDLINAAVSKTFLQLARLFNSAPELDMKLEDVVNNYVGFHSLDARLQKELRVGLRQCARCNFACQIETGKYGRCHAVANVGTRLVETNYGLFADIATSTIERHDLFHYKPNSRVLAVGGLFCNFGCSFCMNALLTSLKCMHPKILNTIVRYHLEPSEVVDMAKKADVNGIAFTINEGTMCLGFILDVAPLARQAGLFVAIQTNGFMSAKTIELLAPNVDAVAIGIKGFGDSEVYDKYVSGVEPQHVLNAIRQFHAREVHCEVTSLTLKSDNIETATRHAATWLTNYVGADIPIHVFKVRSYPWIPSNESAEVTDKDVETVAQICHDAGLVNVYTREIRDAPTYCPSCGKVVVERRLQETTSSYCDLTLSSVVVQPHCDTRYAGLKVANKTGYCAACGTQIYGKW
jgi:pyruvate formate lyase activating enzyme